MIHSFQRRNGIELQTWEGASVIDRRRGSIHGLIDAVGKERNATIAEREIRAAGMATAERTAAAVTSNAGARRCVDRVSCRPKCVRMDSAVRPDIGRFPNIRVRDLSDEQSVGKSVTDVGLLSRLCVNEHAIVFVFDEVIVGIWAQAAAGQRVASGRRIG